VLPIFIPAITAHSPQPTESSTTISVSIRIPPPEATSLYQATAWAWFDWHPKWFAGTCDGYLRMFVAIYGYLWSFAAKVLNN
jgi:hypothetical protein